MQAHPVVIQPPCVIRNQVVDEARLRTTRGLGITQVVIGALTILFGVLAASLLNYWAAYFGFGIWGGIWIVIGGILGISSASNQSNGCLNWTNMSFAIVSSCIVFIDFIVYIVAVGSYNNYSYICHSYYYDCHYKSNDTGIALYSVLLVLALVEFIIALAVAIYCCKNGCSGCCYGDTQGVIIQQHPHNMPSTVILHTSTVTPASYPAPAYTAASYPAASYPVATGPPMYTSQQGAFTSAGFAAGTQPVPMTYNLGGHMDKGAPPAYEG